MSFTYEDLARALQLHANPARNLAHCLHEALQPTDFFRRERGQDARCRHTSAHQPQRWRYAHQAPKPFARD